MPSNFRSELFALCKKIQEKDRAKDIRTLIYNMNVCQDSLETGMNIKRLHEDFAQVARYSNNEFHGYLFLDDNIESISIPKFFKVEHLNAMERNLLEMGHRTLTRFVELCLLDITKKSEIAAKLINPYFYYRPVNVSPESMSIISDEEFQPVISAFRNGQVYKSLMKADFTTLFGQIDINHMRLLIDSMEKEVNQSLGENVTKDIKDFSLKIGANFSDISEVLFAFIILILAMKDSLALACRLLYRAFCGVDLFVLNNDNIITIEKDTSTVLCQFYKVFSQDLAEDYTGSEMGSILLLDCDLPYGTHIHEFGMLISQTLNLAGEFGESAKYSFITINEEMIHIHHLTNAILEVGLPVVRKSKR